MKLKWFLVVLMQLTIMTTVFGEDVKAKTSINLDQNEIVIAEQKTIKQSLSNEPVVLYGPIAETNFYYELTDDVNPKDDLLQLNIKNSKLLIAPSALTIHIDDKPVESVRLDSKESQVLQLKLDANALKKGSHKITIQFSGYVEAEACVPQKSTSNWLSIEIDSFLSIQSSSQVSSLEDYPKNFRGSLERPLMVIIPSTPSNHTLEAAHKLASYLSISSVENTVSVLYENEVKSLKGNTIFLGGINEFTTSWVKEALKNEISKVKKDSLYISQVTLTKNAQSVDGLVVLAQKEEHISEKIDVLTTPRYFQQFSGDVVHLKEMPVQTEDAKFKGEIEFNDFGITNLLLDSKFTKTNMYYYFLPIDTDNVSNASLELHMKRSAIIAGYGESNGVNSLYEGKAELIILINGVPHSVDIQSLEEDKEGNIEVSIPIEHETIKNNGLIALQFETTGLSIDNPCVSTDENKWIYIKNTSKINYSTKSNENEIQHYFNSFPLPFSKQSEPLSIVYPDRKIPNENFTNLFDGLMINGNLPNLKLIRTNQLTQEMLESGNVIFIGGESEHPLLQTIDDRLLVSYEKGTPQLNDFGFIQSELKQYGFIQKNPWNDRFYLAVFDQLQEVDQFISNELISYIQNVEDPVSIVVQTEANKIFTKIVASEQAENETNENKDNKSSIIAWAIGFLIFIGIIFGLILFFNKRKKSYRK